VIRPGREKSASAISVEIRKSEINLSCSSLSSTVFNDGEVYGNFFSHHNVDDPVKSQKSFNTLK